MTLKAGSKVYIPNGFESDGVTKKFDVVVVSEDVKLLAVLVKIYYSDVYIWSYNKALNKIQGGNKIYNQVQSGTFNPAEYCLFYDTSANIIKYTSDTGATWEEGYSLPFALTSLTNGVGNVSIDQVFNGFGYIGNTLFALPGVKCLAANGIDDSGCAMSNSYTITNVMTRTVNSASYKTTCVLDCVDNALTTRYNFVVSDTPTTGLSGVCRYTPTFNQYIYDESIIHSSVALFDFTADETGKIASLVSHNCAAFVTGDALQFNNSGRSRLASMGLPSNKYIDLTLGASGTTYTAPANGYIVIAKSASSDKGWLCINGNRTKFNAATFDGYELCFTLPARAGEKFVINYNNMKSETNRFVFIYAQGEQ